MGKKSKGSNKFMNPTDKSRKDARKKELKKNKKQRLAVRQAVIKQKDPHQILAELERLDDIEFNVNDPPALNEKVIGDKRKKLNETWDRLVKLYAKEEKEKYGELKRFESEYESRRREKKTYYESVRSAQSVDLDEIPLPSMPTGPEASILKKPPSLSTHYSKVKKEPPGPPPGPPPDLSDFEDDEDEAKKRVRFDAQPVSSNDVDEFLKEIEELPKAPVVPPIPLVIRPPGLVQAPVLNPSIRPPAFPFPSDSTSSSLAPTPGLLRPPSLPQSLPPSLPPSLPQSLPFVPRPPRPPIPIQKPLLPPLLPKKEDKGKQSATIEAKPQLRNLSADATRFTPLALRVKRPENKSKKVTLSMSDRNFATSGTLNTNTPSTDDAYEQFMKEMEGML